MHEGVSSTLERELQMVELSATRCSFVAILWVSLVSFAAITLCVASRRMFIVVIVYFVMTQSGNFWIHPRNYVVLLTGSHMAMFSEKWVTEIHKDIAVPLSPSFSQTLAQASVTSSWTPYTSVAAHATAAMVLFVLLRSRPPLNLLPSPRYCWVTHVNHTVGCSRGVV
jgi:hypothetical protein